MQEHLLRFNKSEKLAFIDLETFNLCLNFQHNLPWQVSVLEVRGDTVEKEHDYYVKWDTHLKISAEAAAITHYNDTLVQSKGLPQKEVFDIIWPQLEGADYICGQSILGFDVFLIYEWCRINGVKPGNLVSKIIDTNLIAKGLKMGKPYDGKQNFLEYQYQLYHTRAKGIKTKLSILAQEMGIEFDPNMLHNSLFDLRLNQKVWNKLKWQVEI